MISDDTTALAPREVLADYQAFADHDVTAVCPPSELGWFGDAPRRRVCLVSRSVHATLYQVFDRELSHLLDVVLAGDVVEDRETAERLVRALGALVHLHGKHPIDAHGRCTSCRSPGVRPWPWQRAACAVHTTLSYFLRQPPDAVINTLTGPKPHRVSR